MVSFLALLMMLRYNIYVPIKFRAFIRACAQYLIYLLSTLDF